VLELIPRLKQHAENKSEPVPEGEWFRFECWVTAKRGFPQSKNGTGLATGYVELPGQGKDPRPETERGIPPEVLANPIPAVSPPPRLAARSGSG